MARANKMLEWRRIPVGLTELCLDTTLRCGQSFRWQKSGDDEWSLALHGRIVTLRQDATHVYYRAQFPETGSTNGRRALGGAETKLKRKRGSALPTPPPSQAQSPAKTETGEEERSDDTEALLHRYLNLGVDLPALYAQWSAADANFAAKAPRFAGVRILRQDAWEALVGFICSSNNNIVRIAQMVHKLCARYGRPLGSIQHSKTVMEHQEAKIASKASIIKSENEEDEPEEKKLKVETEQVVYYDFPAPEALAQPGVEATLRQLGFGYRARYIYETACMVCERDADWLESLRNPENPALSDPAPVSVDARRAQAHVAGLMQAEGREGYRRAHEQLLELQGVGPKVADCVCLMGLGWGEAVPVDTHVWQIAVRDYRFKGASKTTSLTPALYNGVGAKFRDLWGEYAGWAHSVLFTADLRAFSEQLRGVTKVEAVAGGRRMVKKEQVQVQGSDENETDVVKQVEVVDRKIHQTNRERQSKQEQEEQEHDVTRRVVEVHEDMISRVKRRRRQTLR